MKCTKLRNVTTLLVLCVIAAPAAENTNAFTFTKIDLEFLDQAGLLDKKLEREGLVYHDQALNSYVAQVGLAMLPAGTAPEHVKYEFHVLRDPMPNAFALPNGSIYVNTGLLSLLENEDQLASVLAHEITHVTDRHGYLHYRDYRKKAAIASFAEYAAAMAPGGSTWGAVIRVAGLLVPAIMAASINGYSRELERDADIYSFNKLLEGNYDPKEMAGTFRLLSRKDEVDTTKLYYNDHPKLEERIAYITTLVNTKAPPAVPADVLAERRMKYQSLTEAVTRDDIRLAILSHKPRTARARAAKVLAFHPDSADNLFVMGETYRSLGPWTPAPEDWETNGDGKKEINNLRKKLTADEEDQQLLAKENGQAAWKENQRLAEENYQKALAIDPNHAKTYLGLGQLYEKQGKNKEALSAYGRYLELQPEALDQARIRQRVEALQRADVH
jgi:beta-barrel assembly-enhancing protease